MIDIKDEPELRHALAHITYAIEALADPGGPCIRVAQMEIESIKELIFWGDDSNQALEADLGHRWEQNREEEDLQGQEELQGKEVVQGQGQVLQGQKEVPGEEVDDGHCPRCGLHWTAC